MKVQRLMDFEGYKKYFCFVRNSELFIKGDTINATEEEKFVVIGY